jgi:Ca2+-binding RTX toxin-like protein
MSTPTPPDMHSPMYMIADLAVGGPSVWPGPADGVSSATMNIDYIRAYQYTDLPPTLPAAQSMKYLVGDSAANILTGGSGDDRIEGGQGNDTLTGGGGADTFVVSNLTGTDTITDFQWGEDKLVIQGFTSAQVTTQELVQGLQVNFGTNHVILARIYGMAPGDIVAGATTTTGTAAADTIDRSAIATPTASIYGLASNDTIKGGPGDDWIVGGTGNDTLTGNGGKDSFVFSPGSGQDIITDFVAGLDRLVLQGTTQGTLQASWATEGGLTGIKVGYGTGGDTVFLPGVGSLLPDSIVLA